MNPRPAKIDACRAEALGMMKFRGREAAVGGYYLEMFTWLYRELERGRVPAGIPARLLEEWRAAGRWNLERRAWIEGRKEVLDASNNA